MSEKKTALITGASAGIGEALAALFAKDGHDVVLVARSEGKLGALAQKLEAEHKVRATIIKADLRDAAAPQQIFDRCADQPIDFLVNNAGFGSSGKFLELDLANEAAMVEVNIAALVKLTHLFGKKMRERGFGRIMNIASTAGFQPGPYMATYYATKAFVISFSEALAFELKGSGVTVTCHCPGATATNFAAAAGNDKSRLFQRSGVAKASEVALHAYRAMMNREVLAVHGAMNAMGVAGVRFSPRSWVRWFTAKLNESAEAKSRAAQSR